MAYKDPEKKKAYAKAYYEANADKEKARSKAWRDDGGMGEQLDHRTH